MSHYPPEYEQELQALAEDFLEELARHDDIHELDEDALNYHQAMETAVVYASENERLGRLLLANLRHYAQYRRTRGDYGGMHQLLLAAITSTHCAAIRR